MRVHLKDVATIIRGAEIDSEDVPVSDEGEYKYVVLDIQKVDTMGCFYYKKEDCIRSNHVVDSKFITQKGDVIAGISRDSTVFMVGDAEEGYIIPSECVVIRTVKEKLLPEYLCQEILCYKGKIGTTFCPAGAEARFWMNFDESEEDFDGLPDDNYGSYAGAKIGLPEYDEQVKKGRTIKETMELREQEYEFHMMLEDDSVKNTDIYYEVLGEIYDFEVHKSEDEEVYIEDDSIVVRTKNLCNKRRIEKLLSDWYVNFCMKVLHDVLKKYKKLFETYNIPVPEYEIMPMDTTLVKCFLKTNKMVVDPLLFTAPEEYVEFGILEGFIWRSQNNDPNAVAQVMDTIIPDWLEYATSLHDMMNRYYCIKVKTA